MAKRVRRDLSVLDAAVFGHEASCTPSYDLVDTKAGQWPVLAGDKNRFVLRTESIAVFQEYPKLMSRFLPKRANPPFVSFAVKMCTRLGTQVQMLDAKINDLLRAPVL